jgi:hypothetical protein
VHTKKERGVFMLEHLHRFLHSCLVKSQVEHPEDPSLLSL